MIFYLNSKEFEKVYLVNEDPKDILSTQYILVSTRVRTSGEFSDIILNLHDLYPSPEVMMKGGDETSFKEGYYIQLSHHKSLLATIISYCIIKSTPIIFLCTKNESKMGYLALLGDYIEEKFGYPVYNYVDYAIGLVKVKPFDHGKVYRKVQKVLQKESHMELLDKMESESGKKEVRKYLKSHPSEMVWLLKTFDMYEKGMTKHDMKEAFDLI